MELIGTGTSRHIYSISNEQVLKKAINEAGIAQNRVEIELFETYKNTPYGILLTPCERYDKQSIIMEKRLALPTIIRMTIFEYIHLHYPHIDLPDWKLVQKFMKEASLYVDDVCNADAWGVSNHQAGLIDYGCTNEIYMRYYA